MVVWQAVLAGAALLFLGYLLVRMRPSGGSARGALSAEVRAARDRARKATDPRERAEAYCRAGNLALENGGRPTAAAGFFLRAIKADPTWAGAIEQVVAAFSRRRPRLLEKMLWRRLGNTTWDAAHRPALRAAALGLERVYQGRLRDGAKRDAMKRLAADLSREG